MAVGLSSLKIPTKKETVVPLGIKFDLIESEAIVDILHCKSPPDIIAQYQKAAKTQPCAKAGRAKDIGQTIIPGIADVKKQCAANCAEADAAKRECDVEAVDEGKAQFLADQEHILAPDAPARIKPQIPAPAHIKTVQLRSLAAIHGCPKSRRIGNLLAQPEILAIVCTQCDEIGFRALDIEGVANRKAVTFAVHGAGSAPQRIIFGERKKVRHQQAIDISGKAKSFAFRFANIEIRLDTPEYR